MRKQYEKLTIKEKMDLSGFETYLAYSLRGAIAQDEANENSTVGQSQTEEKKSNEETQQDA